MRRSGPLTRRDRHELKKFETYLRLVRAVGRDRLLKRPFWRRYLGIATVTPFDKVGA